MDTNSLRQELAGQTYQHAVVFDLDSPNEGETASYQLPDPWRSPTLIRRGRPWILQCKHDYHLTVYKNEDTSPHAVVLYQASFKGPSTVRKMSIATQGATDVVFLWSHKTPEPEHQDTFILADPVLSGGMMSPSRASKAIIGVVGGCLLAVGGVLVIGCGSQPRLKTSFPTVIQPVLGP